MKPETLAEAVRIGTRSGHVLIATSDSAGTPHVAAAGRIELDGQNIVAVTEWFCPGTVENLRKNAGVSIVAWDRTSDTGYQLIGRLETAKDVGVLDGYSPQLEGNPPLPQVERRLAVRVERVLDFSLGPHSDTEE